MPDKQREEKIGKKRKVEVPRGLSSKKIREMLKDKREKVKDEFNQG